MAKLVSLSGGREGCPVLYVMNGSIRNHLNKQERNVIVVFEAEQYDPILAITTERSDFMEIDISPCTTPEAGLAAARKFLGK